MSISPRATVRALVFSLVCAGAVALTIAAGARPASVETRAAAPPGCRASQLVAYLSGENGAAGTIFYTLNFANLGSACTLRGYPGVSAVNAAGKQLGASARRQKSGAIKTVTLKSATATKWSTASTTLGIVEALNFPRARCHATLAAGLRVFPPNGKTALAVPLPFTACASKQSDVLTVRAVR